MSSLNKAMIIGRLGDDPEVRYTQSNTAVATLSIATSERYKDKQGEQQEDTEWHRVILWDRTAEVAQEYLKKGSLVYIEGPIQTRKWEDKNGVTRYTTEIKGLTMTMLESKNSSGGGGDAVPHPGDQSQGGKSVDSSVDLNEDFDDLDDDLPF